MALLACGAAVRSANELYPWSEGPYDRAREACGLEPDDALPLGGGTSEVCMARMALDVGLQLDDSADVSDPDVAYVLSGVDTVLAADQGAASALLDDRMPSLLREIVGSHHAGPETTAAAFWYWLLTNEIEELRIDPALSDLGFNDSGTVSIRPLDVAPIYVGPNGEPEWTPPEFLSAMVLVHEASHGVVPGHSESCDGHCDQDMNGAYGFAAVWEYEWLVQNGSAVPEENCAGATRRIDVDCGQILEPGFPCTEVPELLTSCE